MADMLLDLVKYLETEGLVTGDGLDTFRDMMPESPDKVITLQEYPGLGTIQGAEGVSRAIQLRVRSTPTEPDWAQEKCWRIFSVLCSPQQVLDLRPAGSFWGVLHAMQTPFKMAVDESNRVTYGFNVRLVTYRDY